MYGVTIGKLLELMNYNFGLRTEKKNERTYMNLVRYFSKSTKFADDIINSK